MFLQTPIDPKRLVFATTIGLLSIIAQPARSATFTALNSGVVANVFTECINDGTALVVDEEPTKGWHYATDSFTDGVNGWQIGGNVYEIFGLALKETEDSIWVALNSNLPLTGENGTPANDGNIGWGDLFFNFSGRDFTTASHNQKLFAVRFAETNDSFVPQVGLYGNVTATSTTGINSGFSSIASYNQSVAGYGASLGDLPAETAYFDQNQSLNAMGSGDYLTGITFLTPEQLEIAGYDPSRFGGQYAIAFKFDKATICQMGFCQKRSDSSETVPEPSGILGLLAVGLGLGVLRRFAASVPGKKSRMV
jgi:hypothetical protein